MNQQALSKCSWIGWIRKIWNNCATRCGTKQKCMCCVQCLHLCLLQHGSFPAPGDDSWMDVWSSVAAQSDRKRAPSQIVVLVFRCILENLADLVQHRTLSLESSDSVPRRGVAIPSRWPFVGFGGAQNGETEFCWRHHYSLKRVIKHFRTLFACFAIIKIQHTRDGASSALYMGMVQPLESFPPDPPPMKTSMYFTSVDTVPVSAPNFSSSERALRGLSRTETCFANTSTRSRGWRERGWRIGPWWDCTNSFPAPAPWRERASCSVGPLDLREASRLPNIEGFEPHAVGLGAAPNFDGCEHANDSLHVSGCCGTFLLDSRGLSSHAAARINEAMCGSRPSDQNPVVTAKIPETIPRLSRSAAISMNPIQQGPLLVQALHETLHLPPLWVGSRNSWVRACISTGYQRPHMHEILQDHTKMNQTHWQRLTGQRKPPQQVPRRVRTRTNSLWTTTSLAWARSACLLFSTHIPHHLLQHLP